MPLSLIHIFIYQVSPSGRLLDPIPFASGNPDEDVTMTSLVGDDERAVAAWVAGNNKRAGKGTGTLKMCIRDSCWVSPSS